MSSFTLSRTAINDMKSIGSYTQKKWGIEQRKSYLRNIDDSFHLLANNPKIGLECNYVRTGLRKYNCKSHIIFYQINDSDIFIVRILHKSIDVNLHRFRS